MVHPVFSRLVRANGFTLVELLIVMIAAAILATVGVLTLRPLARIENARYAATKEGLYNIAQAAKLHADEHDAYASDVNRSIPSKFSKYINPGAWSKGPFPGSVYDWDNWQGLTCWDGSPGGLQVTLRQVNQYQGKQDYTIYYVMKGQGIPHCSDAAARGECINCVSRYP